MWDQNYIDSLASPKDYGKIRLIAREKIHKKKDKSLIKTNVLKYKWGRKAKDE